MLKNIGKFIFMIELGLKYIGIFEKTFFNQCISLKPAYKKLSIDRQNYANAVLEFLNIEVKVIGTIPTKDKILYAMNHRSLLDILVMENIFSAHNKSGTWIAKQELFDSWLYGKFFRASGCMSVDLNNGKGLLKFFKKMKNTAVIINVARGSIINEEALYRACKEKQIGGAVIDTWYQYPQDISEQIPPSRYNFNGLDNVIMSPHASTWTDSLIYRRTKLIAENLNRLARGEPLLNVVKHCAKIK